MAVGERGLLIHLALPRVVGAHRPEGESVITPHLQMVVQTVKETLPISAPVIPTPVQRPPQQARRQQAHQQQAHQHLPVSIGGSTCESVIGYEDFFIKLLNWLDVLCTKEFNGRAQPEAMHCMLATPQNKG